MTAAVGPTSELLIPTTYLVMILVVATLVIAIIVVAVLLCFAYYKSQRVSAKEHGGLGSAKVAHLGITNPQLYTDKWEIAYQVNKRHNNIHHLSVLY